MKPRSFTLADLPALLAHLPTSELVPLRWYEAVRRELQRRTVAIEQYPDGTWHPVQTDNH